MMPFRFGAAKVSDCQIKRIKAVTWRSQLLSFYGLMLLSSCLLASLPMACWSAAVMPGFIVMATALLLPLCKPASLGFAMPALRWAPQQKRRLMPSLVFFLCAAACGLVPGMPYRRLHQAALQLYHRHRLLSEPGLA